MKKILLSFTVFIAFSAVMSAQQERDNVDDRQQQEPPREAQLATDRAARQADVNTQNSQNVIQSEDRLRSETERSTGKEMKNPATTNPITVKPPVLSDPPTAPVTGGNR
jgi:Ni/Co efflux regulator RcnB